jgi:outer membrane lipoprotein-sorting protein
MRLKQIAITRYIAIILLAIFGSTPVFAAETADQILDRTAKQISTAPSIKANYSLATTDGGKASGTMTLCGDKFTMTSGDMSVWFDGKTQWTLIPANEEVNITEPTQQELQQVNPVLIIKAFRQGYTATMVRQNDTEAVITLKAKQANAEIPLATVTISKSNYMPREISFKMSSGQRATIRIPSITTGKKLATNVFQYPKSKYPNIEIVDLR